MDQEQNLHIIDLFDGTHQIRLEGTSHGEIVAYATPMTDHDTPCGPAEELPNTSEAYALVLQAAIFALVQEAREAA